MLLGTMTGSWKILLGSWKSPRIVLGKAVGTLMLANQSSLLTCIIAWCHVDFFSILVNFFVWMYAQKSSAITFCVTVDSFRWFCFSYFVIHSLFSGFVFCCCLSHCYFSAMMHCSRSTISNWNYGDSFWHFLTPSLYCKICKMNLNRGRKFSCL